MKYIWYINQFYDVDYNSPILKLGSSLVVIIKICISRFKH